MRRLNRNLPDWRARLSRVKKREWKILTMINHHRILQNRHVDLSNHHRPYRPIVVKEVRRYFHHFF